MEELFELRTYIEGGRYADALVLLGEMEEMSREDKINKIAGLARKVDESQIKKEALELILKAQQAPKRRTKDMKKLH